MTNIAKNRKITNATKFQTYKEKKPRRAPKCPQISQKSHQYQGFFLLVKNTRDKYRKNNKSNKNHDLERVEAKKCLEMSSNVAKNAKVTRIFLGN